MTHVFYPWIGNIIILVNRGRERHSVIKTHALTGLNSSNFHYRCTCHNNSNEGRNRTSGILR